MPEQRINPHWTGRADDSPRREGSPDRERAKAAARLIIRNAEIGREISFANSDRVALVLLIADALLTFAASEVEACHGDPTFRAEELRSQIGLGKELERES